MMEFLSICVLTLIVCVGFLFWCTQKLHDLITEALHLICNNTTAIGKVQDFSYNTHSKMIEIFRLHLLNQHGIYDESEEIDDGK